MTIFSSFIYYFWLHWYNCTQAVHGLSLVAENGGVQACGVQAPHCGGFSRCTWAALVACGF